MDISTFTIPLGKIKRARYFKREANHLMSKAALLTQNLDDVNAAIRSCIRELDGGVRAFLIGHVKSSDILTALHLPLETHIDVIKDADLEKLEFCPCLDVFLFCYERDITETDANKFNNTICRLTNFKIETFFFVDNGPSNQRPCESGTQEPKKSKYRKLEGFKKISTECDVFEKESFTSFAHKDQLLQEIDLRLEMTILQRLKQMQDKLSDKDVNEKVSRIPEEDIRRKISSIFDKHTLLVDWNLEWEKNEKSKERIELQSPSAMPKPPTIKNPKNFFLYRLADTFTKCICDSFVGNLKAVAGNTFSSAFETSQYELVSSNFFKSVLNNMQCLFGLGESENFDELERCLKSKMNDGSIYEAVTKSYEGCLQSRRKKITNFCLHRIDCEIASLLYESKIERFKELGQRTTEKISDTVAEKLFSVKFVTGFGYSFGTLLIDVEESCNSEKQRELIDDQLKKTLYECDVKDFSIRTNSLKYEPLHRPGTKFITDAGLEGTLGGFAEMHPLTSPDMFSICGLVSGHVIQGPTGSTKAKRVYIMGRKHHVVDSSDTVGMLDIATFEVNREVPVQTKFRNSFGEKTACKLCKFSDEELVTLIGKRVHIWGSATTLGLGTIVSNNFQRVDETLHRLIIIEDASQDQVFCREGDSGSIVLKDHPDGYVVVLAMLIGKNERGYLTFRLIDGLESLAKRIQPGVFFKLCDEQD